jgi:farnesyl-diphosphate farnesyltransferase
VGRDLALQCLNHHVADALALAPSCLRYMQKLRHPDVFKFCAIPQVMAIATLEGLANNADVFTGVVKIRKGQALLLMSQAGDIQSVYAIFLRYSRLITAAIPRRHKAAFAAAQRAGEEVEKICLDNLAPERSLASRALLSPSVVAGVLAALVALLRHLYLARGAWEGYMPRITDSWDVAACVGAVACVAYLLGCGGMMFVAPQGGGRASPPQSRAASPTAARQRAAATA